MSARGMTERARRAVREVEEVLAQAGTDEARTMADALRRALLRAEFDAAQDDGHAVPACCPRCGCVGGVVRRGHDRDGAQRWYCKDCGRSFGRKTGKVAGMSKLPPETWMAYVGCFCDRLTLRECAERVGVSLKTSFFMRHRLLEVLARLVPPFLAGAGMGAELDETYFPESFKGNHGASFRLPRKAHRRGKSVRMRGLSAEQICVASGVNDAGGAFLQAVGRGPARKAELAEALRGRVEAGAIVSTDQARAYAPVLAALGAAEHRAYPSGDRSQGTINRVNALRSSLDGFMRRFRGVSTKHLGAYLSWFLWRRAFSATAEQAREAAARQMSAGTYRRTWGDYVGAPAPFMGYWEGRAGVA